MTQTRIAVSHITKRYFLYRTALERLLHAGSACRQSRCVPSRR